MADPRSGRRWQALARWVITRDKGKCWRCGHDNADTAGHILPVATHPHLALDPNNLRAEHGTRRTPDKDGYECIGNYAAGINAGQKPPDTITRRDWMGSFGTANDTPETSASSEFLSPGGGGPVAGSGASGNG